MCDTDIWHNELKRGKKSPFPPCIEFKKRNLCLRQEWRREENWKTDFVFIVFLFLLNCIFINYNTYIEQLNICIDDSKYLWHFVIIAFIFTQIAFLFLVITLEHATLLIFFLFHIGNIPKPLIYPWSMNIYNQKMNNFNRY